MNLGKLLYSLFHFPHLKKNTYFIRFLTRIKLDNTFKHLVQYWANKYLIKSKNLFGASLVAQMVKNPSAMQEPWVQSLGQEDPLEKEMATHSSTLAWKILIGCLFVLSMVSFVLQKLFSLIQSHLLIFCFYFLCLRKHIQKYCYKLCQRLLCLWFP